MSIGVCWRVKDWNPLLSEQSTGPAWFDEQWKIFEGTDSGDSWRVGLVVEVDLENGMLKSQGVNRQVETWSSYIHLWQYEMRGGDPRFEVSQIRQQIQHQLWADLPGLLDGSTL